MKLNFHKLKAYDIVCREELCMLFVVVNESSKREYRSLVEKGPSIKYPPTPIIVSIFRKGLKSSLQKVPTQLTSSFQMQYEARLVYSYTEYNI